MDSTPTPGSAPAPLKASPLVFITGASSGIGEALALRFRRAGYRVALVARRVEALQAWAQAQGFAAGEFGVFGADVRDVRADEARRMRARELMHFDALERSEVRVVLAALAHDEKIISLFPAATHVGLKGAGHWLHAEKPREFLDAVTDFLGEE